jgi:glycosyltransferase involved in cell wall biosynthesis
MKNKIIVGYIFECSPSNGGNFQTEISTAIRLKNLNIDNIEFKFFSTNKKNLLILQKYDFNIKYFKKKRINLIIIQLYNFLTNNFLKRLLNFFFKIKTLEKFLIKESIDLVHFNSMSENGLLLNKIDYGVTFWDMAHLEYTLFPESKNNFYSLSAREFIYKHLADNSLYIVTDCNENKTNFHFRYNVKKDKISIIYSEPSNQLIDNSQKVIFSKKQLIDNFKIKTQEYIFYPAQYWAHKNHIYIFESLNILINKYHKEITFVFSGSDKKNLEYLKSSAERLGVSGYVKFLDFVSEEIIYNLYKNSFAVIAPTYFGPTNHLPIEAFYFEKPLFYSDIFCDNEQVQGAAIKIDLNNPDDLSEKIFNLLQDTILVEKFSFMSREKFKELKIKTDKNREAFIKIFEKYKILRKTFR